MGAAPNASFYLLASLAGCRVVHSQLRNRQLVRLAVTGLGLGRSPDSIILIFSAAEGFFTFHQCFPAQCFTAIRALPTLVKAMFADDNLEFQVEANPNRQPGPSLKFSPRCAFCRDPISLTEPTPASGLCRLCESEIEELGWRTVYDREQNVGQIPANLRMAYKL